MTAGVPNDAATPSAMDPGRFLHALRKRWLLAFLLGLPLAAVSAGATWMFLPKTYRSMAVLQLASSERMLLFSTADSQNDSKLFDMFKRTQKQLIRNRYVITPALRDESLKDLPVLRDEPDPVLWLESNLAVNFPDDAEIMTVSLSATNPEGLHLILNSIVKSYFDEVVYEERTRKQERLNELELARTRFESQLRTKRTDLKELIEKVGDAGGSAVPLEHQNAMAQYSGLRQQLQKIRFELLESELMTQFAAASNGQASAETRSRFAMMLQSDGEYASLVGRKQQTLALIQSTKKVVQKQELLEAQLAPLQQRIQELDLKIEARKNQLRQQIEEYAATAQVATRQRIQLLKSQEARLEAEMKSLEETIRIPRSSTDVEMLRMEVSGLQDIVSKIAGEIERTKVELRPDSKSPEGRVKELSKALPAVVADAKSRMSKAAGAGVLGFLLPVALLVWLESRVDHVHSGLELVHGLGLSLLGTIPLIPRRIMKRLSEQSEKHRFWRTRLSESVDAVAAVILRERKARNLKVIMVSSATAGEGKTTLAANLATSLSCAGYSTILVDFDLRRPTLQRLFDLELQPGVYDVLQNGVDVEAALQPTELHNLMFLAAGRCHLKGLAGLKADAMNALFQRLRADFDFAIIDASPILPVVDTRLTAQYVDTVVLSVLRDVSRIQQLKSACDLLTRFSIPICGVVMTGSKEDAYPQNYDRLAAHAS